MINVNNSSQASANFTVPEASSPVAPTIEGFSTVYSGNPTQFATKDQADALASFLGGKVVDLADQWSVFHVSPLYQVELPNGVSLNAGLLADRFRRYGTEAALKMTEAEAGGPISTHAPTPSAAPAATPVASPETVVTPPATTPVVEPSTPSTLSASALPAKPEASAPADDTAKVLAAAKQFEALLLGTILKTATPEDGGGVLSGQGDSAGASVYQMAMEQFAQVMSDQGGLGLANQVTEQIRSTRTRVSTVA
jgi:hypothetical protein